MHAIHAHLQDTLQSLYRKAIDADESLDKLHQAQQGKFHTIFSDDSGFRTRARRFTPYVEEIAGDWQTLREQPEAQIKSSLPELVKKIELMLTTLNQFKAALVKP